MKPSALDSYLDTMATPVPPESQHLARALASATRPTAAHRRRPRRWLLPGLAVGAILLTAGAATATVVMSHWGRVSMPLGNVRSATPLQISWTTETGHSESCRVWIELRHPDPSDGAVLDAAIESHDWDGLGQDLYAAAAPEPDDPDGEARVSGALVPVLKDFVAGTFPGIIWLGDPAASTTRAVDAWGMTCAPEAE